MICVPIHTEGDVPIGVASFHNPSGERELTKTDLEVIETYVEVLSMALLAFTQKDELGSSRTVFIVHGHDHLALTEFELITLKLGIKSYILQNEPSYGMTIIEILRRMGEPSYIVRDSPNDGRRYGVYQ